MDEYLVDLSGRLARLWTGTALWTFVDNVS